MRTYGLGLATALALTLGVGCNKPTSDTAKAPSNTSPTNLPAVAATNPPPAAAATAPAAAPDTTVARLHWLGKKRLNTETNAAYFMTIWNLPESARLEAQTLDKLALAIGHWQPGTPAAPITNYQPVVASQPAAALVRPLLQDLLEEESYFEIRQPATNQPGELALAIKLNADRAAQWQAAVTNALFPLTNRCELARVGDWTLLGVASSATPTTNTLLADLLARFRGASPVQAFTAATLQPGSSNAWIEADLDLARTLPALALNWKLAPELPKLSLLILGDGTNVRTRAELEFPKPLGVELEAWHVPTNFIHDPLIGFTAVRGIRPGLKAFEGWRGLRLGDCPPNQAFFWAQAGAPCLHFMAFPSEAASNQLSFLADYVLREVNPILAANTLKLGMFQLRSNHSLVWRGIPLVAPNLGLIQQGGSSFIVGGLFANRITNQIPPPEMLEQFLAATNMLMYDWEVTQPCVQGLTTMAQLARRALARPVLSHTFGALPWLQAIPAKLSNSVTAVRLLSPTRLGLTRVSSMGLTGIELQILADWLESPAFPRGFHTFPALSNGVFRLAPQTSTQHERNTGK